MVSASVSLRTRLRRVVNGLLVIGALITTLIVVLFDVAALIPGVPVFSFVGGIIVPSFVPIFLAASLIALLVTGIGRSGVAPRVVAAAAIIATTAAILSALITLILWVTITRSGGSVDVLQALTPASIAEAQPDTREVYTRFDDAPMYVSIYRPEAAAQAVPILIAVHGGGWTHGSADQASSNLRWFADQGWLVLSFDYPLSTPDRHLWDVTPSYVACALAWTASNAGRLGADIQQLALMGDSAGGNLVINTAYAAASGVAVSSCGGDVPVPRVVVAVYPVVDPVLTWANDPNPETSFMWQYLGGTPAEVPERYAAVASATYITRAAPPTLILLADHDTIVPPQGADRFIAAARAASVLVERVNIPFADHGFDGFRARSIGNQGVLTIIQSYLAARVLS